MARRKWRGAVGGLWDQMGKLQFDFLIGRGLLPSHRFLDVGCGCLRGGVHFIRYLDAGRYFGVDNDEGLLAAARDVELDTYGLTEKEPVLVQMDQFQFDALAARFDFGIAQSVFTHLPLDSIRRCLSNLAPVLAAGGRFYATFFESAEPRHRDPFRYPFETFEAICEGLVLTVSYVGAWGHPRGQKMMEFVRV